MRMRNVRIALIAAALWSSAAVAQPPAPPQPAPAPGQPPAGDDGQLVVDVTGGRRAALPIAVPYMPTPAEAACTCTISQCCEATPEPSSGSKR